MNSSEERAMYSISIEDVQHVAEEALERKLTIEELKIVENKLGSFINWYDAVENTIDLYIKKSSQPADNEKIIFP